MTDRPDDLREVNELLDHFGTAVDRGPDLPAAQPREEPATPSPLDVEAWVAGYIAGREDDQWRTDDEIVERAVDAVCAIRMDEAAAHATERPDPDRWNLPFGSYAPVIADTPVADPPPGWSDRDVMQRVLSALENPTEDALRDAKDELRYRLRAATERPRTEPLDVPPLPTAEERVAVWRQWGEALRRAGISLRVHEQRGGLHRVRDIEGDEAGQVVWKALRCRLSPPAATQEGEGE